MKMTHPEEILVKVFRKFVEKGQITSVAQNFSGLINQTYFLSQIGSDGVLRKYVMQCMNRNVFKNLPQLMDNVFRVSQHMEQKSKSSADPDAERSFLNFLCTLEGNCYIDSEELGFWRMYRYIAHAVGRLEATTVKEAYSAGKGFGKFQCQLADMPPPRLYETLSRFHDTRNRYDILKDAASQDPHNRLTHCKDVLDNLLSLEDAALAVQKSHEAGRIPERVVHNDAKLSNVLLDEEDGRAVCIIDLDTCMPGLSLHDFGDLMRSICTNSAEDTQTPENIQIRFDMFEALVAGFLDGGDGFMLEEEKYLMPDAGITLTSEVAVRFLTDYLSGDVYFQTKYPEHNLVRARAQMTLAQKFVDSIDHLREIVSKTESDLAETGK
ncbi:MAG: aminoglycoside phosphotransferase family protein [Lentisphaerae bacterium]|jgi:hypothetical protein|nr:aminoglycoside phosphotransferase family protein [Lentisphaerota bacterium]